MKISQRMKRITGGALWALDHVLFGTKLGKVVILAALVGLGVPTITAVPIADTLNSALDGISPDQAAP